MSALKEIEKIKKEYEAKIKKFGAAAVAEIIKGFFKTYPDVKAVKWEARSDTYDDTNYSFGIETWLRYEPDVEWKEDSDFILHDYLSDDLELLEQVYDSYHTVIVLNDGILTTTVEN